MRNHFQRWICVAAAALAVFFCNIRASAADTLLWNTNQNQVTADIHSVPLAKLLATAATVGSGAVGGVFTPTLFLGCAIGALFGGVLHTLLPGVTSVPAAYALVGMGGFLAATTHAPLTSILTFPTRLVRPPFLSSLSVLVFTDRDLCAFISR